MTKKTTLFIFGIIASLLAGVIGYFWTMAMIDSLYAYRSPLKNSPPQAGQSLGPMMTRKVVFILVDGLRVDTSLKPAVMPVLAKLRAQGASAVMHSEPPSYSEPGYTVLLTGAWPEINDGPAINHDYANIPTFTQDNIFSAAYRDNLSTGIAGYYWFEKLVPQNAVGKKFYTSGDDSAADGAVVDAALPWIRSGDVQLLLIHLDQVDYAGHHEGGPRNPNWDAAAYRSDQLIGEILANLDLTQDTILVCSDHGHIDNGGHGGNDPVVLIEPLVLAGKGVRPGDYRDVKQADVAPTLAVLLGTNLPASSQGQPLVQMLNLEQSTAVRIPLAIKDQQANLVTKYAEAIGMPEAAKQLPEGSDVAAYQEIIRNARTIRINIEMIPYLVIAILMIFGPAIYIARIQASSTWPLIAGALVFILLFNIRWAIVDGETYSLSSIPDITLVVEYFLVTVVACLTVAWLAIFLGNKWFRLSPFDAAQQTLHFVLMTIFLLSIPVWFDVALNGFLITWHLPEFTSQFLGLLCLMQIVFVALIGLILIGLSAGISFILNRRTTQSTGSSQN